MVLTGVLLTVGEPLLGREVLVPGVVAGEALDREHGGVVEDLVLLVQDGERLLGGLVFVEVVLRLGQEGRLLDNVLVFANDVGVAGGQPCDVLEVLLVGLLVDPRVDDLGLLGLERSFLLLSQVGDLPVRLVRPRGLAKVAVAPGLELILLSSYVGRSSGVLLA